MKTKEVASGDRLADAYLDFIVRRSPETATALGIHERDDELDDRSEQGIRDAEAEESALLRELEGAAPATGVAATDRLLIQRALRVDLRVTRDLRSHERNPSYYVRPLSAIYTMTARDYAPIQVRAAHVMSRIEKLPGVVALGKVQLKTPPKVFTEVAIEAASGAKTFLEEERSFLRKAPGPDLARIDRAVTSAISAYADYVSFLRKELLPRSSGDFRAGKDLFDFLLHEDLALKESSSEILALGKAVFERTENELEATAKKIDPHASTWREVVRRVKGNHPKGPDLIAAYAKEVARAKAFLIERQVVTFPKSERCEVVETPSFQRSTTTAAYDQPAPFDPVTQGLFFVTPVDLTKPPGIQEEMLRENDYGDIVDTVVHEAYPGHHLQLSHARIHPSKVRKVVDSSLFAEGWALYSEELMNELGYYKDEERLMQLEWTLVRAARVLIDIGLHTGSMTIDDAVLLLTKNVGLERPTALAEVRRYTMSPTQPLSYLVGREMIFRLRERYKSREGARYSLLRFHDELLSHGTIPLGFIEREMFEDR